MNTKHNIIKFRRGTASEWENSEPQPGGEILKLGEPGYEKDTGKLKIGDGTTPWNSLSYFNDGAVIDPEELQDLIGDSGFLVEGTGINISYNDGANSLTISTSGVSYTGHTHVSYEISDFNTAVSGLLPVKDIVAGPNMSVSSSSGIYTISTDDEASALVTTVFNKTGSPIPKFSVVYINGGQGDMPTIALASASGEMTSSKTYGITSENIAHMSTGKVIVDGALTGVNTDQFNPTAPTGDVNGAVLYLSPTTPGGVTTTKPSAPNHMVSVGTIIRTHQNEGVVEVKIQNGYELQELHNVAISGVTTGQMLYYNASNLWVPTSGISYNPITNLIVFDNDLGLGYTPGIFFGDVGDAAIRYSATNEISIDALRINLSDSYMNSRLVSTVPYVLSLGTLTGSNAINYGDDRNIQTLTLNGTAVTFTKGTGWPTSISRDVVLKITVSSPTSITWTIVNEWYNQAPAGALAVGTHLFLLRAVGTTIEGHYIGYKTAP